MSNNQSTQLPAADYHASTSSKSPSYDFFFTIGRICAVTAILLLLLMYTSDVVVTQTNPILQPSTHDVTWSQSHLRPQHPSLLFFSKTIPQHISRETSSEFSYSEEDEEDDVSDGSPMALVDYGQYSLAFDSEDINNMYDGSLLEQSWSRMLADVEESRNISKVRKSNNSSAKARGERKKQHHTSIDSSSTSPNSRDGTHTKGNNAKRHHEKWIKKHAFRRPIPVNINDTFPNATISDNPHDCNRTYDDIVQMPGQRLRMYILYHNYLGESWIRNFTCNFTRPWVQAVRMNTTKYFEYYAYHSIFSKLRKDDMKEVDFVLVTGYKSIMPYEMYGRIQHLGFSLELKYLPYILSFLQQRPDIKLLPFIYDDKPVKKTLPYFHGPDALVALEETLRASNWNDEQRVVALNTTEFYRNTYITTPNHFLMMSRAMSKMLMKVKFNRTLESLYRHDALYREDKELTMKAFGTPYYQLHCFVFERLLAIIFTYHNISIPHIPFAQIMSETNAPWDTAIFAQQNISISISSKLIMNDTNVTWDAANSTVPIKQNINETNEAHGIV